jgi:hypothetical protein
MNSLPANHLSHIANFYGAKIGELQFFLEKIVHNCDESLRLFKDGRENNDKSGTHLAYHFSAYTNTIQTLKDAAAMLSEDALPWSQIKALRHGAFITDARNAVTHDGNPIVAAWADGRYFVPNKIVRLERDKVIVIDRPMVDIRQLCLEFSAEFATLLGETLKKIQEDERLSMSTFDIDQLNEALESELMPSFAKELIAQQRSQIIEALSNVKTRPIEKAIKKAEGLAAYCEAQLAKPES